uniref:Uncharacterized protein n=1 Tax=Solanum tuberosum TaxID=4113 RepID=M1ARW0_SOLTU
MRKETTDLSHWAVLDAHHLCFERFICEFVKHIFSILSNSLKHLEPLFHSLCIDGYIFCQHSEIFLAVP